MIHTLQLSPCCLASRLGEAKATARRVAKMAMRRILNNSQGWVDLADDC